MRKNQVVGSICVLVAVAVGAALFVSRKPRLETNPGLQAGQEYRTFVAVRSNIYPDPGKDYHYQAVNLLDDRGTVYDVPTAWQEHLANVTRGEIVSLPPTWHQWQTVGAPDIPERALKLGAWTTQTDKGQKIVRAATVFQAPAPKAAGR